MKDNIILHFFSPYSEPPNDGEPPGDQSPAEEQRRAAARLFWSGAAAGVIVVAALCFTFVQVRAFYGRVTHQPLSMDSKVSEIMGVLDAHSINAYKESDLKENMYRGFVAGVGDPYTTYFDAKSLETFMQTTEGTYGGIGVVVSSDPKDKLCTVVTAYDGEPGALAGLKPGDKFIKINGTDVSGASLDDITSMTKGQAGTSVLITIYRPGDDTTFDVKVVRQKIDIPTIKERMLRDNIGYIRISAFDRVTLDQFENAYKDLENKGMSGLIIDLRNNPGGLLDVVTKIADTLCPEGVIVYTEDKNGHREYTYSDRDRVNVPLAVLVNGNSASASEVLSGAIKDLKVGVLVGEKTFGKGIVQNLYTLSDGSAVKVTVAKYYTPSGVCIQGEGIIPDYVAEMSDEDTARIGVDLTDAEDGQLLKAIEVVDTQMAKKIN